MKHLETNQGKSLISADQDGPNDNIPPPTVQYFWNSGIQLTAMVLFGSTLIGECKIEKYPGFSRIITDVPTVYRPFLQHIVFKEVDSTGDSVYERSKAWHSTVFRNKIRMAHGSAWTGIATKWNPNYQRLLF